MTGFFALLRLQLLSRYADLKPKNWKNLDSKQRRKTVGMACLYVFLILYLGGMMLFIEIKAADLLLKMGPQPNGMIDLLVIAATAISMVGTLIMSFFFILSSLYLSRDSVFLAALPLKPRTILSARLAQIWISETGINALILLPACILYGVRVGVDALYWIRLLIVWLFAPTLPIFVGAIFSTLLTRASALLKHRETFMTVGGLVLMVAYFYVCMSMGSITGSAAGGDDMLGNILASNAPMIRAFSTIFPPAGWAVTGLLGDWSQLGLFAGVGLAAMLLLVAVLGIWYRTLSMLQADTPAATGKKGIQKGAFSSNGSALSALTKREIRQILRVPAYATNIFPVSLMPALMVVMMGLFIGRNLGDNGEGLTQLLPTLPGPIIVAAVAAYIGFMADMNPALSTSVTREGRGHDFMLALPVPMETHLRSKLIVGYGLSLVGIATSAIALCVLFPAVWKECLLACALCVLYTYICSCLSLAHDVRKPKLNWVTEQEAVKQNFGVLLSMLVGLAMLGVLGVISYFLIAKANVSTLAYFAIIAAILALGCVGARVWLSRAGAKYYTAQ